MRVASEQVAHLWANQSRASAEGSASTSFAGPVIYSYAEPIGRLLDVKGRRVALFRDYARSITSSKHQGWMKDAAKHLRHFIVEDIGEKPSHKANIKGYVEKIAATAKRASRANAHVAAQELRLLITEARDYCDCFGLSAKPFEGEDAKELSAALLKREASDKKKAATAKAKEAKRQVALLADWLAGKPGEKPKTDVQYARIEGKELATTMGARVPVSHVRRAAKSIRSAIAGALANGLPWASDSFTIRVGEFQIDRIDVDGTLHAGCHTFTRDEVMRILNLVSK